MPEAVVARKNMERLAIGDLCDRIEEILRDNDKIAARALIPTLRIFRERVARLRSMAPDFATLGLGPYVVAVAELAGRGEEFAAFA
jgi:hypothetical protein